MRLHPSPTLALALALMFALGHDVRGHSVAQVQTAKRISRSTVALLDPQGNPAGSGGASDTVLKVGDVISFVFQFTPVPNNASRGAGGYITEYIPPNTVVVGARIIDRDGNTVTPHRGPQMNEGFGPRASHANYAALGLQQGSLSQLYADTGIFFSTDPRTRRTPTNQFLTVQNGLAVEPSGPTGGGQLDNFLGFTGPPFFGHNEWDLVQTYAFGVSNTPPAGFSFLNTDGRGNTPFGYGSAVAGPDTHYPFEVMQNPACGNGLDDDNDGKIDFGTGANNDAGCASALDNDETTAADGPVGPWQRIRYGGSEVGSGSATNCVNCCATATPPATCNGLTGPVRVGVSTGAGFDLSLDNPLPAATNAVRFAVGELVVGEEYFAEITLRVTGLPLDPNFPGDVNCSEVFGGDAAQPQQGQDNTWRYFVPSPACVVLNNFFELSVDKLVAAPGEVLTYKIEGKNLSVNPQTNVVVTSTFVPGDVDVATLQLVTGPAPVVGASTLTWNLGTIAPGGTYTLEYRMTVRAAPTNLSTLHRATYVSTELPAPGFSVVALTDVEKIVIGNLAMSVTPTSTTAGSTVRYRATLTNSGTGDATFNGASFLRATMPTELGFCGAPTCVAPTIRTFDPNNVATGGGTAANPALSTGPGVNYLTFTNFAGATAVAARGGRLELEFDAVVAAGANGLFQADIQAQVRDNGVGRDVENFRVDLADLLVDVARSDTPTITTPILAGATSISGVTTEGPNATIIVFVNGVARPPVLSGAGGAFTVTVPTLYGGQGISATAQAATEVVSLRSTEVFVLGAGNVVTACNDGTDNEGDGKIDFPADPGCTGALDPDETDLPQCSDGLDNDGDGIIDFPNDPGCATFVDNDEAGPPACQDGIDNDGDGLLDLNDTGCTSATDVNEADTTQCSNGLDDDADGTLDYPFDPGCFSALDDDEVDTVTPVLDAGTDAATDGPLDALFQPEGGVPFDPGGINASGGGCCDAGGSPGGMVLLAWFVSSVLRRRRASESRRRGAENSGETAA